MGNRALLLLFMTVMAACTAADLRPPNASTEEQIRELMPGLKVDFENGIEESQQYALRRFSYTSAPRHEWPYGTGFAVLSKPDGRVLWIYLHNGDYAPHTVHWADFDADSQFDLFFHAGSEDVFTTHVYLNRVTSAAFGVSQFAQAYENDEVYGVVTDVDSNGQPELLIPQHAEAEDDPCAERFREYAIANERWRSEYARVSRTFQTFNFTGGAASETDTLELFSKVRLVSFGRPPAADAVRAHLQLRAFLLTEAAKSFPEPCRTRAAEVVEHVEELLSE